MTHLFNDPTTFAAELRAGYAAAYGDWVTEVRGGVVRTSVTPPGEVALINGGGSGHYPAFAGLVGPGLVHGTAMGDLFASPSAAQVVDVAREAAGDAGVLFLVANYAGDVLNFEEAATVLRGDGVEVDTVYITDDVSSAPATSRLERRGIAGGLAVYKIAGAAAAQGMSLSAVASLARAANDRTRTLGIAFGGCTFPGATEPHMSVPDGMMAIGMGIHGEPGIDMVPLGSADRVARLLVERLIGELPEGIESARGQRVAVILNGLGSVKYEELFVTYATVARALDEAGVSVVQPEVGEFVTSFDMAGLSLSLIWLDDELERLWAEPASSPGYRKGRVSQAEAAPRRVVAAAALSSIVPGSPESKAAAAMFVTLLEEAAGEIARRETELGRLDSVAGDGDHGIGMRRGVLAGLESARRAVAEGAGVRTTIEWAAEAWADRGAGTSGALWGTMLMALAGGLSDATSPDAESIAAATLQARRAVMERGGATVGDKTMVDAIVPFVDRLVAGIESGESTAVALADAAEAATIAARETAHIAAKLGRARTHAESSLGSPDPGAVSFSVIVSAAVRALGRAADQTSVEEGVQLPGGAS